MERGGEGGSGGSVISGLRDAEDAKCMKGLMCELWEWRSRC